MLPVYKLLVLLGVAVWSGLPDVRANSVITGAERLEQYLPYIEGKRVALVVNQTSVVGENQLHLLDALLEKGVRIEAVFAPEHGFRGTADAGETVKDGRDSKTGVKIISLYGKNKKPTPEQLKNVEVVLFDIQDVGARFYTYISTMHYVMEACAGSGIRFIVLDRPNPCDFVDGPLLEEKYKSFVGMHPIPLLHGCTVGELALMINGEGWLATGKESCRLTVIRMLNWKHGQPYLLPVKPSPNLPNDRSVQLYPSLCLFEATGISVGRGTTFPFQVIGAPAKKYGSFTFTPVSLPGFDKNPLHKDQLCYGVDLRESDFRSGFTLRFFLEFYRLSGEGEKFFTRGSWFDLLAGTGTLRRDIVAGKDEPTIRQRWQAGLDAYKEMRRKYLLY